jgi:glycosyltransferase involved in cell wall biosynthesis
MLHNHETETSLRNHQFTPLHSKLKILLINCYDMHKVLGMYKHGLFPGHHLFGAVELKKEFGVEMVIPKQEKYGILNKIGNWFDIPLVDQQLRALNILRHCDILYTPFAAANTKLIVLGKLLGLIRKPVVILVHFPLFGKPSKNRFIRMLTKRLIEKYDTVIFFSKLMRSEIIDAYNIGETYSKQHFLISPLGVDLNFFKKYRTENNPEAKTFLVSSGNTGRDFDILIKVAERINFPFKIYCKPESFPKSKNIPANVELLSGEFPFGQICQDIANARIVLIPLAPNPQATIGLVSLLETLALGKPVIMTKNKYIDVDFEKENIGVSVGENDVDGWVQAIMSMLEDYHRLKEMGENSLRLAKEKFNINIFAKDLAKAMNDTHQRYLQENSK